MCPQSVSAAVARPRVAGGDGGLQHVRPRGPRRPAERLGPRQRRKPAPDQEPVPARAVLVEQQDRLAVAGRHAP